jgi:hypothetical protein
MAKFRVRRYGAGAHVFLERKTRRGLRVRKRRIAVDGAWAGPAPDGPGSWFGRAAAQRRLRPVAIIAYDRRAFEWTGPGGPVRVTFDRAIRGTPADGWRVPEIPRRAAALLDGAVVAEFKYRGALPDRLKRIVLDLGLSATGASKYRRCVEALGLAPPRENGRA